VWTARIGTTSDPCALNIARTGGDPLGALFAPSMALLAPEIAARKADKVRGGAAAVLEGMQARWPQYREAYLVEMRASYRERRRTWESVLARPKVILLCFCVSPEHCHRTVLAADVFAKLGARHEGELTPHHCHARGCATSCPPEHLMCARHWRMVPSDLQRAVWATYRPGQCDDKRPSAAWHAAADAAIAHVAERERLAASGKTFPTQRALW